MWWCGYKTSPEYGQKAVMIAASIQYNTIQSIFVRYVKTHCNALCGVGGVCYVIINNTSSVIFFLCTVQGDT